MPLIYGKVSDNISKTGSTVLNALQQNMRWQNSNHLTFTTGNVTSGVFFDKALPCTKDEIYFECKKSNIIVLFSGTVYNRKQLDLEYTNLKIKISTPELLLLYFQKYGPDFVSKLNGDFAFMIHSEKTGQTYIFRDHLGVKPMSYIKLDGSLLFSSDGPALAKVTTTKQNYDERFHLQYFTTNNLWDYEQTPNKNLKKLLPGHYLDYNNRHCKQVKYWFPEKIKINKGLDVNTAVTELKEILKDAVDIRADKSYNAAAHLSGGLDSGVVAALSRKAYSAQSHFFGLSWSPKDFTRREFNLDERDLARDICKHSEIELRLLNLKVKDVVDYYSNSRSQLSLFSEHKLRQNANELGINLIFSGWGGDEFISCPNRGIDSDLFFGLHWKALLQKYTIRRPKRLFGALYYNVFRPFFGKAYFPFHSKQFSSISKYLRHNQISKAKSKDDLLSWSSRRDVHLGFIYNYHLACRLEEWDVLGERQGIQYRYPLLDKRVVEYAMAIPSSIIYKHRRVIMKKLGHSILPESAVKHAKVYDQAYSYQYEKLLSETFKKLCLLIPEYRKNPLLSFVNFDVLQGDIDPYFKQASPLVLPLNLKILFLIHRVHVAYSNYRS